MIAMNMLLELVQVPVTDIDRAKDFYTDRLGFSVDVDVQPADGVRIVQLTPPGSACSIGLWAGVPDLMAPGSVRGLHLVVDDVGGARNALLANGVAVSEIDDHPQGVRYAYFSDPDGNTWALQEMPWRSASSGPR